ncbi:MAG TPA: ABC transporter substrate binding protein [Xanthobacteraceae bacterium]|nr:ABC transporter substrate binding protein [Xanthobacteraceae bacterium]
MIDRIRARSAGIVAGLLLSTLAVSAPAQEKFASKWFRYGPGVDSAWTISADPAKPLQLSVQRKARASSASSKRVLVLYPRPSSAYDIAITKILQEFDAKDVDATVTVINFEMNDVHGTESIQFAENNKIDLIFAMGSESTAWLFDNYRGGRIPVVSVCSKDPVQLGQIKDYERGSGSNFAFTSLNVPVEVQMAYVKELRPDLKNLAVLVDSKNVSAVQTQAEPIASFARQTGIQVIWGAVQNPSKAREELVPIVQSAVQTMRKSDPDLSKSLFWMTGSTSVFLEIRTVNEHADRVPVVSVVPPIRRCLRSASASRVTRIWRLSTAPKYSPAGRRRAISRSAWYRRPISRSAS